MSLHQHELYEPKDFTSDEYARRNVLAVMVIDGGLGVCKKCGAAEIELETWVTCQAYRAHSREQRVREMKALITNPEVRIEPKAHVPLLRRDQSGWMP